MHGLSTPSCCCCCSLRLLFNGLMPKNDDDEDDEANDGCQPHRIQLFGHCVFLLHVFCICICVCPPASLHLSVSLSARRPGGWWWWVGTAAAVRTLEFNLISVLRSPASQKLLHLTLGWLGPGTDVFAGECESVLHNFTIFHLMLVSCRHRRRRQRRRDVCLINCHLFDVSLRAVRQQAAGTQPGRSAHRRHSC